MKSLKKGLLPIALTALGLGLTAPARATVVQPLTLPEIVQRSTTIVHGTVQETHTAWEDGKARLYTYVTVSASEFLKGGGAGQKTITFRQIGGRDGNQVIYVPGSPQFGPKQEVLLFLTGDDAGGYPQVMGIFQGAFRPVQGRGGERRIEGIAPGAVTSLLPEKAKGSGPAESPSPPEGSFEGFLGRIRSLVKDQAAAPHRPGPHR